MMAAMFYLVTFIFIKTRCEISCDIMLLQARLGCDDEQENCKGNDYVPIIGSFHYLEIDIRDPKAPS